VIREVENDGIRSQEKVMEKGEEALLPGRLKNLLEILMSVQNAAEV